jgi:hypothetical protein
MTSRSRLELAALLLAAGCAKHAAPTPPEHAEVATTTPPAPPPDGAAGAAGAASAAGVADGGHSLEEICAREHDRCAPYDVAVAKMAAADGGMCFVAEWGTCGALRYTDEAPGGLLGTIRWYDAAGNVVALQTYNIEHGAGASYGSIPSCARKPVRDLCRARK